MAPPKHYLTQAPIGSWRAANNQGIIQQDASIGTTASPGQGRPANNGCEIGFGGIYTSDADALAPANNQNVVDH